MKQGLKEFYKYASFPIMLLALFAVSLILYTVFDLPSYEEINARVELAFAVHGYWVVFFGALAEGILFANWYLPGSVVVVMGVAFAQQSGLNVFGVVSLITLGFFLTTILNYALFREFPRLFRKSDPRFVPL